MGAGAQAGDSRGSVDELCHARAAISSVALLGSFLIFLWCIYLLPLRPTQRFLVGVDSGIDVDAFLSQSSYPWMDN